MADAVDTTPMSEAKAVTPGARSPIASLFAGWLTAWQDVNALTGDDLSDENMSHIHRVMSAAEDAILALPAKDAADVWRKVVVTITCDGPGPRTQAGQLLAAARTALGIAA